MINETPTFLLTGDLTFFYASNALRNLRKMYIFQNAKAENMNELENRLKTFYSDAEKPKLLEDFYPKKSQ